MRTSQGQYGDGPETGPEAGSETGSETGPEAGSEAYLMNYEIRSVHTAV